MYSDPTIALIADTPLRYKRLFDAVCRLFDVRCITGESIQSYPNEPAVLIGFSRADVLCRAQTGVPCLAFLNGPERGVESRPHWVRFSELPFAPQLFRGATLLDRTINAVRGAGQDRDLVVAQEGDCPLWLRPHEAPTTVDLVTVRPPILNEEEYLYARFTADDWFSLLPLLSFVKRVAAWSTSPVRANFMFDDPNLHWPSYGYVRFEEIGSDAEVNNYHVAFATIPLDGWFVHQRVARSLRDHQRSISLLVHGNDHTKRELAQGSDPTKCVAVARQALRRISRIERAVGVPVPRIMAAPHGACSEVMARALLHAGFEAACISRGSLMARNLSVAWPLCVGLRPAEFLGGGFPVIPRFHIKSDPSVRARLAAFLGQPVISVGHHEDLAGGLELLRTRADVINRLGDVTWSDMRLIARGNYWTRREDESLHVRMFSRTIAMRIPSGITHLRVERPWLRMGEAESLVAEDEAGTLSLECSDEHTPIPVRSFASVTLRSVPVETVTFSRAEDTRSGLRAVARRSACEVRDRMRPKLDAVRKVGCIVLKRGFTRSVSEGKILS